MRLEQRQAKVARLAAELEQARIDLRDAIVTAREHGESVSEIARRLKVTRARVYQMIR